SFGFTVTPDGDAILAGRNLDTLLCATRIRASGDGSARWTTMVAGASSCRFTSAVPAPGQGGYVAGWGQATASRAVGEALDVDGTVRKSFNGTGTFILEDPAVQDKTVYVFEAMARTPQGQIYAGGRRLNTLSGFVPEGILLVRLWE